MDERGVPDELSSRPSEPQGSLRRLIDALQQLMSTISSRLRHTQIQSSAMGEAKGDYDIGTRLRSHVERLSAESRPDTKTPTVQRAPTADVSLQGARAETVQTPNELAEGNRRKATSQLLPRMDEQLQRNTMEHINASLILAREGNTEGAKLHIQLAENAMQTASRFMSHEEYQMFEQKVERRLEAIVDRDRAKDADT